MTIRSQIMDFVTINPGCTRSDILKFLLPLVKGRPYNWRTDRGWYSCHLQTTGYKFLPWNFTSYRLCELDNNKKGYLMRPSIKDNRYLIKRTENGKTFYFVERDKYFGGLSKTF